MKTSLISSVSAPALPPEQKRFTVHFKRSGALKTGLAACMAAAAIVSAPAQARAGASEAPLCAELAPFIKAAKEKTPFESLYSPTRSSVDAPASLTGAKACQIYMAGNRDGVVGGGEYNFARCGLFYGDSKTASGLTDLQNRREALIVDLKTCKAFRKMEFTETEPVMGTMEWAWSSTRSKPVDIIVREKVEKIRPRKTARFDPYESFTLAFEIRAPKPKVKKK